MLHLIAAVLLVPPQSTSAQVTVGKDGPAVVVLSRDRAYDPGRVARRDSLRKARPRIIATPAQIATAFLDPTARTLIDRARVVRNAQDSSILSYDATSYQRLTTGFALTKLARDRIFFRHESSARVRWQRDVGAQIDVTGKRTAIPMMGGQANIEIESMLSPVPYFPGRDALWVGARMARDTLVEGSLMHPLAAGAEAVYRYHTGDSVSFHLPDGKVIQLREVEVHPRVANWKYVAATLWFDVSTAQLVRAAYRMSEPMDMMREDTTSPPPFMVKAMFTPTSAALSGVAVEFGLIRGFWLPRSQVAEGYVRAGFLRIPIKLEERFRYASVNGTDTVITMPTRPERAPMDTTTLIGLDREARRKELRRLHATEDSVDKAQRVEECDKTGTHSVRASRYGSTLDVIVFVPCDSAKLAQSPDLPASIFDPGEEVFGDAERDILLKRAEEMKAVVQSELDKLSTFDKLRFLLPPPSITWTFGMLRYNRVEGLSSGLSLEQRVGDRYGVTLLPRIGMDMQPNADLILERRGPNMTTRLTGFRRLVAANDWGNPLSFGASISAALFGDDEGFYYRAAGAEITGEQALTGQWNWRVFYENQRTANAKFSGESSLAGLLGGPEFLDNVTSSNADQVGFSTRTVSSYGLDPRGFRLLVDSRAEAATGVFDYTRGALDLTLSRGLGRLFGKQFAAAISAGAGMSGGTLPPQRQWFLGGLHTIRGESPGVNQGNSYWLSHLELGRGSTGGKQVLFLDLGWAGDRTSWNAMGRPSAGWGWGWSLLDGLIRVDVARGIYPVKQTRFGTYLEARF